MAKQALNALKEKATTMGSPKGNGTESRFARWLSKKYLKCYCDWKTHPKAPGHGTLKLARLHGRLSVERMVSFTGNNHPSGWHTRLMEDYASENGIAFQNSEGEQDVRRLWRKLRLNEHGERGKVMWDSPLFLGFDRQAEHSFDDTGTKGPNFSQLMHFAGVAGMEASLKGWDAFESGVSYEYKSKEGIRTLSFDALNDLIANEAGRLLGNALLVASAVCDSDGIIDLDPCLRQARSRVAGVVRSRLQFVLTMDRGQNYKGYTRDAFGLFPPGDWDDPFGVHVANMVLGTETLQDFMKTADASRLTELLILSNEGGGK
jgi:hypothetical protein